MDSETELRRKFINRLESCRLQLSLADSREQLRDEMLTLTKLLTTSPRQATKPARDDSMGAAAK